MNFSLRFAILHHTGWAGQPDHYDLLLEHSAGSSMDEPALVAWRTVVNAPPAPDAVLTPLPAHRRRYLEYEGPVLPDRGAVKRVGDGTVIWVQLPIALAARPFFCSFGLVGSSLSGAFEIRPTGDGSTVRLHRPHIEVPRR